MEQHIIYLIIGILLIIGGVFAFRQTHRYLKLNTTSNSNAANDNQFWGFALWAGYIGGGILTVVGVICLLVSIF